MIDAAGKDMGFTSLYSKMKLPRPLMTLVGHVCDFISWGIGRKLRINSFTVSVNYGVVRHSWGVTPLSLVGGTRYNKITERAVDGGSTQIRLIPTRLLRLDVICGRARALESCTP